MRQAKRGLRRWTRGWTAAEASPSGRPGAGSARAVGGGAIDRWGEPIRDETLTRAKKSDAVRRRGAGGGGEEEEEEEEEEDE